MARVSVYSSLFAMVIALLVSGCAGGPHLGRPIERLAPQRYLEVDAQGAVRHPQPAAACPEDVALARDWPPPTLPGRRATFASPPRPLWAAHPSDETHCCGVGARALRAR